jgi:hypothetical protein
VQPPDPARTPDPPAPADAPPPSPEGPLQELGSAYDRESRDPKSAPAEARIRALFGTPEVPADMLRDVSCHETVCKVGVYWSVEQQNAYMIALMGMINDFGDRIAWRPDGAPDRAGRHPMDVFVVRR